MKIIKRLRNANKMEALIEEIRGYVIQEGELQCYECNTAINVLNMIEEHKKKETK